MKSTRLALGTLVFALLLLLGSAAALRAADDATPVRRPKIDFIKGPAKATMKDVAEIQVPVGYVFTGTKGAQAFLEAEGNIKSGREMGFLAPTNLAWFVVFEYEDSGYVKDDDKDKLNPDKLLNNIKQGNEAANEERQKRGMSPLHVVGWERPPHYNEETHNLEWGLRAESEGTPILNYNTRLLGRKGMMSVTLVSDPDKLKDILGDYNQLLGGYAFQSGQRYAEYRQGDKVAKYGLAALVAGGAAVGAAKLGLFTWLAVLFKKFSKLVIVAFVAMIAAIKRFLAKLFGRRETPSQSPPGQGQT